MESDGVITLAVLLTVAIIGFFAGVFCGHRDGEKSGYIKSLQDMKKGNPPSYVLVEQPDGTTVWESNKEQGK